MKIIERLFELQELEMGSHAANPESRRLIETIRKEIPGPVLGHYDRLIARGKKGVALVQRGVCSGCRMKLASGVCGALLRDEDIAMCDSCARYLLLVPDLVGADEVAPAPAKPKRARRTAPRPAPVPSAPTD